MGSAVAYHLYALSPHLHATLRSYLEMVYARNIKKFQLEMQREGTTAQQQNEAHLARRQKESELFRVSVTQSLTHHSFTL